MGVSEITEHSETTKEHYESVRFIFVLALAIMMTLWLSMYALVLKLEYINHTWFCNPHFFDSPRFVRVFFAHKKRPVGRYKMACYCCLHGLIILAYSLIKLTKIMIILIDFLAVHILKFDKI